MVLRFVSVNPLHVKRSKELDDNSPTKNDVKDAKVIGQLIKDGRYAESTISQGVYAELRVAKKLRDLLNVDLQIVQGQVHNWLDRYFPEFLTVFKSLKGKAAIQFLKLEALPHELVKYTEEELLLYLRQVIKRSIVMKKIRVLKVAANRSIDIQQESAMGLSLIENTTGKHKGQTKITKRGRKKLRTLIKTKLKSV